MKKNEGKSLTDLQDMVEDSADKIAFLEDFFSHGRGNDADYFSVNGKSGFYHILVDLQDDLKFVVDKLVEKRNKGLIVETREES